MCAGSLALATIGPLEGIQAILRRMNGTMDTRLECLRFVLRGAILRQSLGVMGVVGTLLNVINQGDVWLRGEALDLPKILLTFAVPFCVATFGAWSALVSQLPEEPNR